MNSPAQQTVAAQISDCTQAGGPTLVCSPAEDVPEGNPQRDGLCKLQPQRGHHRAQACTQPHTTYRTYRYDRWTMFYVRSCMHTFLCMHHAGRKSIAAQGTSRGAGCDKITAWIDSTARAHVCAVPHLQPGPPHPRSLRWGLWSAGTPRSCGSLAASNSKECIRSATEGTVLMYTVLIELPSLIPACMYSSCIDHGTILEHTCDCVWRATPACISIRGQPWQKPRISPDPGH